ncbi:hypothetical protein J5N97_023740 [Dioscorea zingiberensis]|uniref:Uncharacterized protein n=1 Tax=Dioscorea zingiberensis TaxID=325984 RepID=A0A9D5C5T2_9LILI|nr:hypothetical protein J5N97_023740 [Dioscorea zingiberensis]
MASDYSMGFYGAPSSSVPNSHMLSFQSGMVMNNSTALIGNSMGIPSGQMSGAAPSVAVSADPSSSSVIRGVVSGLKWNPGLSREWSAEEDDILKKGLSEFSGGSKMIKYIKIAATLHDKNVRDVALRCRWLNEKQNIKRHKPEDHHVKKSKERKGKVIASSMLSGNMVPPQDQILDTTSWQLLNENTHLIGEISSNLEKMQVKDNPDLLDRLGRNILLVQERMYKMSQIMREMPPLPVSLNDEFISYLNSYAKSVPQFVGPANNQLIQGWGF